MAATMSKISGFCHWQSQTTESSYKCACKIERKSWMNAQVTDLKPGVDGQTHESIT